jgi:hypothetical protein
VGTLISVSRWAKPEGTFRIGTLELRLALIAVYAVFLLGIPSNIGIPLGVLVLTPSRIVLCALAVVIVVDGSLRDAFRSAPKAVLLAWLVFIACAAVTTMLNFSTQAAARYGSLLIEGPALWLIVWCTARQTQGSRVLQLTLVATTVFVAGATLVLAAFGLGYTELLRSLLGLAAERLTDVRFGLSRQEGSFPAPLFFATWLVGATMLILPWLEEERLLRRTMAWAAWVVLLAAAVLTVSRVGIVVALAGTGLYFLLRKRTRTGIGMLVLALIVAVIMARVTFPSFLTNSNSTATVGSSSVPAAQAARAAQAAQAAQAAALTGSTTLRVEAIKAAWPVLLKKPLFGWGLLSAAPVLSAQIGRTNYVDNTYVGYLVELGLLGSAGFALLVLSTLGTAVRRPWSPAHISRVLALVALLGMAALASFLGITQGYAAFVLVIALVAVRTPTANEHSSPG